MELCPSCSQKVLAESKFCHQCGAPLQTSAPALQTLLANSNATPEVPRGVVIGGHDPSVAAGAPVQAYPAVPMQTTTGVYIGGVPAVNGGLMRGLNQFLSNPVQYTVAAINLAIPNGHFQVGLPRDVVPGQVLKVTVPAGYPPHTGKVVEFMVPPHATPGGRVMVPLPYY